MTDLQLPVPDDAVSEPFFAAVTEHVIGLAHAIEAYAHGGSKFDMPADVREENAERLVVNRLFVEFAGLRGSIGGDDRPAAEVRDRVLEYHVLEQWLPKLMNSRAAAVGMAGGDVVAAMDRQTEAVCDRVVLAGYMATADWVGPGGAGV